MENFIWRRFDLVAGSWEFILLFSSWLTKNLYDPRPRWLRRWKSHPFLSQSIICVPLNTLLPSFFLFAKVPGKEQRFNLVSLQALLCCPNWMCCSTQKNPRSIPPPTRWLIYSDNLEDPSARLRSRAVHWIEAQGGLFSIFTSQW